MGKGHNWKYRSGIATSPRQRCECTSPFQSAFNSLKFRLLWVAAKARGSERQRTSDHIYKWRLPHNKPKPQKGQAPNGSLAYQGHPRVGLLLRNKALACKPAAATADLSHTTPPAAAALVWFRFAIVHRTHPGSGLLSVSNVTGDVIRLTLSFRMSSFVRKPKTISSTAWRITVLS